MTTILPVDDRRLKVKGEKNEKTRGDDSTRAFLNFSRENLNISHSEIEQGFNLRNTSRCFKINRQMILSLFAVSLALVCFAFETIKIQKVIDNRRDIEIIKRDLETLRHRIYEEDFLDELKAFEQQMYADEDDGSGESDIDEDYDSNYDDYETSQNDYTNDYETTLSMKTDQTTEASGKTDENKDKVPLNFHSVDEKRVKNSENAKHTKKKRFITEEPPIAHGKKGISMFLASLSRDAKNETKNSEFSTTHPPKKYYRRKNQRSYHKTTSDMKKSLQIRGMSRRNTRVPRQIFAANYGADSSLFHESDEHTGNGRARHNEGIFKAWRPDDWMDELGMNRHFSLARDGRLTIHETGVYLVYAQIHYLDEHDENGFHLLVNGKPILQCMVYSPGTGHKSRSCFSAQVTYLLAGDRIVLKDVGPARYTLFQRDKSFFGLAKLGDTRQHQHPNQMKHNISLQPQTTPLR